MARHVCAMHDCDRTRRRTHAMCGLCWGLVPEDVAREVYAAADLMKKKGASKPWLDALNKARAAVEANGGVL